MKSIFEEIKRISGHNLLSIDRSNYNRFMVLTQRENRTKTAYCFGVPIYNIKTGNLVDLRFSHNKNGSFYVGSEAKVTLADKVCFQNQYGVCELLNLGNVIKRTENIVVFENNGQPIEAIPTLNGLMLKMKYDPSCQPKLRLRLDRIYARTVYTIRDSILFRCIEFHRVYYGSV